jgi:ankyrin repeat protein
MERKCILSSYIPDLTSQITPRLIATITKRTDINSVNLSNETPLHRASLYGNTEFVKMAVRMKADLNIRNK